MDFASVNCTLAYREEYITSPALSTIETFIPVEKLQERLFTASDNTLINNGTLHGQ